MRARSGLVAVTTGLSVLACSGTDSGLPDGAMGLSYTIATVAREPSRSDAPVVFIDGIAQRELDVQYASVMEAASANHRVELRAGDTILAAVNLSGADVEDCTFQRPQTSVVSFTESVCEYDSGDLRLGAPTGSVRRPDGTEGQCIIDGSASCGPECRDSTCGTGAHCTSIVTLHAPVYSHLGCAPVGTVSVGGACNFISGSDGDHDDCGSGSVCVTGTCRALCADSCGACAPIEGEPAELSFCM